MACADELRPTCDTPPPAAESLKPCCCQVCNPRHHLLHGFLVLAQVLQPLPHGGRPLVAQVDDVCHGVLILATLAEDLLALVQRFGDRLRAGGEVAALEYLDSRLSLLRALPARASLRTSQLGAVAAQVVDHLPLVKASVHLRHVRQREATGVAGGHDVDVTLVQDLGQVAHLLRSGVGGVSSANQGRSVSPSGGD